MSPGTLPRSPVGGLAPQTDQVLLAPGEHTQLGMNVCPVEIPGTPAMKVMGVMVVGEDADSPEGEIPDHSRPQRQTLRPPLEQTVREPHPIRIEFPGLDVD